MWDAETGIVYDFGKLEGVSGSLNPRYVWSPDGSQILLFLTTLQDNGGYQINLYRTDLTSGEKMTLVQNGLFTETEYFYLTNAYWR
jgi:Tol biopolymer transport system component